MKRAIIGLMLFVMTAVSLCACATPAVSLPPAVSPVPTPSPVVTAEPTPTPTQPRQTEVPLALLEEQIEDKYAVEIIYGDAYTPRVPPFSYDPLTDQELIRASLVMIDEELSKYPKDLLTNLRVDESLPTRIILCTTLYEGMGAPRPCGGGFTEWDSQFVIFIQVTEESWAYLNNAPYICYAFNHEIGHMILFYIERIAKGSPFDYTKWNSLNPPGFKYDEQIEEDPLGLIGSQYYVCETDQENIYFCDIYSKSALAEDIATMFGYAMSEIPPEFLSYPKIQSKMAYYFSIVRQALATDTWDNPTYWEKALIN